MVNKTQETDADVSAFLESVENKTRREDAKTVLAMMSRVSGLPAKMWGAAIVGFGSYHYKYASGRVGKYTPGKSCFYVNKLADIDLAVLEELVVASLIEMEARYPS